MKKNKELVSKNDFEIKLNIIKSFISNSIDTIKSELTGKYRVLDLCISDLNQCVELISEFISDVDSFKNINEKNVYYESQEILENMILTFLHDSTEEEYNQLYHKFNKYHESNIYKHISQNRINKKSESNKNDNV